MSSKEEKEKCLNMIMRESLRCYSGGCSQSRVLRVLGTLHIHSFFIYDHCCLYCFSINCSYQFLDSVRFLRELGFPPSLLPLPLSPPIDFRRDLLSHHPNFFPDWSLVSAHNRAHCGRSSMFSSRLCTCMHSAANWLRGLKARRSLI